MTCVNTVLFSCRARLGTRVWAPLVPGERLRPWRLHVPPPLQSTVSGSQRPAPLPLARAPPRGGWSVCARSLLHSLLTSRERRALTLFLRMAFQQKNYRCRLGRLRPVPLFRTDNRESGVVSGVVLPRGCVGFCHDEQFYHPWVWDCKSRSTS